MAYSIGLLLFANIYWHTHTHSQKHTAHKLSRLAVYDEAVRLWRNVFWLRCECVSCITGRASAVSFKHTFHWSRQVWCKLRLPKQPHSWTNTHTTTDAHTHTHTHTHTHRFQLLTSSSWRVSWLIYRVFSRLIVWFIKMSENGEKCWSMFPKSPKLHPSNVVVLSTTQRYSVYCHRGVNKPENILI